MAYLQPQPLILHNVDYDVVIILVDYIKQSDKGRRHLILISDILITIPIALYPGLPMYGKEWVQSQVPTKPKQNFIREA